ncbi:MAG: CehA/McbA family metallohydrolase [Planctomycetota bacterium]|jgi:hypothetical protein
MKCPLCVSLALAGVVAVVSGNAFSQDPPEKIVFVQPQAGGQVSGMLEVRVKVEGGAVPAPFYVGLAGARWREMDRDEGASQWVGTIDTTLAPNGEQPLTVITYNRKVRGEMKVNVENPLKVFFADLHSHTGYSDGTLLPSIAHDYARNVARLHVFCLTDHLEKVDDAEWLDTREVAWKANEDGRFVAFPGLEWTKGWGHVNIFDPKTRRWPEDPKAFYRAAAAAGLVAKFNHPGDGTKSHAGLAYSEVGDKTVQLMEVRKLEEEQAFLRALKHGWHIAPEGSDDTHGPNWGNVRSWTGILAPGLSKQNILDALAKRRCFSTLDRNCIMLFRVNGAEMGAIIEKPARKLEVLVVVDEADRDDRTAKIELFEDGKVVDTDEPNAANRRWETTRTPQPGPHYYFAKVTQADGNMLWSAPIWATVAGQ